MAIFKINKTKDYTIMSNRHLKEKEMSLKAKGLLSVMLSLPESWDYSINGLVAICKENESAINSTLKELKEFGYLRVDKLMPNQTKSGRIEYIYNIFEAPQEEQGLEKQDLENQGVEFQGVENHNQLTKKSNINNIIIAEQIITYLNEKAGTNFKPVDCNLKFITSRLKDYTEAEIKAVIDKKVKEWKGTEMQQYIRPKTLFNATNFESYINGLATVNKSTNKHSKDFTQRQYTDEELEGIYTSLDDIEI